LANEPQVGSLEIDTEALKASFSNGSPEPVRIEVGALPNEALPALVASLEAISERLVATEGALDTVLEKLALIAAPEPPVVTVNVPETVVHVHVPETVIPEPRVEITTPAPIVNVELPTVRKTVKFERSLMGSIEGATVEEEVEH